MKRIVLILLISIFTIFADSTLLSREKVIALYSDAYLVQWEEYTKFSAYLLNYHTWHSYEHEFGAYLQLVTNNRSIAHADIVNQDGERVQSYVQRGAFDPITFNHRAYVNKGYVRSDLEPGTLYVTFDKESILHFFQEQHGISVDEVHLTKNSIESFVDSLYSEKQRYYKALLEKVGRPFFDGSRKDERIRSFFEVLARDPHIAGGCYREKRNRIFVGDSTGMEHMIMTLQGQRSSLLPKEPVEVMIFFDPKENHRRREDLLKIFNNL